MTDSTIQTIRSNPFEPHFLSDTKQALEQIQSYLGFEVATVSQEQQQAQSTATDQTGIAFSLKLPTLSLIALEGPACKLTIQHQELLSAFIIIDGIINIDHNGCNWCLKPGDCLISAASPLAWRSSAFSMISLLLTKQQVSELIRLVQIQSPARGIGCRGFLKHSVVCWSGENQVADCLLRSLHLALCITSDLHASCPSLLPHLGLDRQIGILLMTLAFPELRLISEARQKPYNNIDKSIDGIVEYIELHLSEPLQLSDIEDYSHYSKRSLQYAFQRRFGCTMTQWIRSRRLDLAHNRLCIGAAGDSVSHIARACGYRSMSLFSLEFQQRFHVKPSALLREARTTGKFAE